MFKYFKRKAEARRIYNANLRKMIDNEHTTMHQAESAFEDCEIIFKLIKADYVVEKGWTSWYGKVKEDYRCVGHLKANKGTLWVHKDWKLC